MDTAFKDWWQARYGLCGPTGFSLREFYQSRWFRIHSLPDSKRYPENEKELKLLLSRQNEVATEILGERSSFFLTATLFNDFSISEYEHEKSYFEPDPDFCFEGSQVGIEGTDRFSTWTTNTTWSLGEFDDLITRIANDESPHMIFVSKDTGRIYAPYDGGADLILESENEKNFLKEKYSKWLSNHPLGL